MTEERFSFNLAPLIPYSSERGRGPPQINQVLGLGVDTANPDILNNTVFVCLFFFLIP